MATLPFTAPLLKVLSRLKLVWADPLQRFCLIWFGFVLVFFSLSGTKLPHYVFYGYSGLFMLMALHVPALRSRVWLLMAPAIFFAGCLLLPRALEAFAPRIADPYYREALGGVNQVLAWPFLITAAAALLITLAMMRLRRVPAATALIAAGVMQAGLIAQFILPAAGEAQQSPIREAAGIARDRPETIVMWGLDTPSFIVYSGRLVDKRTPRAGDTVLTKTKRLGALPAHEVLFQKNGIALVQLKRD